MALSSISQDITNMRVSPDSVKSRVAFSHPLSLYNSHKCKAENRGECRIRRRYKRSRNSRHHNIAESYAPKMSDASMDILRSIADKNMEVCHASESSILHERALSVWYIGPNDVLTFSLYVDKGKGLVEEVTQMSDHFFIKRTRS